MPVAALPFFSGNLFEYDPQPRMISLFRPRDVIEEGLAHHSRPNRRIRERINQDKTASRAAGGVSIEKERLVRFHFRFSDAVHFQLFGRLVLKRIHIDAVPNSTHARLHQSRGLLQKQRSFDTERLRMKPNNSGGKAARRGRKLQRRNQHVAAAEVNFIFELQRDRFRSDRLLRVTVEADNRLHPCLLFRRQSHKRVAWPQ